jgi:hypothetical protein
LRRRRSTPRRSLAGLQRRLRRSIGVVEEEIMDRIKAATGVRPMTEADPATISI